MSYPSIVLTLIMVYAAFASAQFNWQETLRAIPISHSMVYVEYKCANWSTCPTSFYRYVAAVRLDEAPLLPPHCTLQNGWDSRRKYAEYMKIDPGVLHFRKILGPLRPNTHYNLTLFHSAPSGESTDLTMIYDKNHPIFAGVKTMMIPGCIQLSKIGPSYVSLGWRSYMVPKPEQPVELIFIYALTEAVPVIEDRDPINRLYYLYAQGDKRVKDIKLGYQPDLHKENASGCGSTEADELTICKQIQGLTPTTGYSYALLAEYVQEYRPIGCSPVSNTSKAIDCATSFFRAKSPLIFGKFVTLPDLPSVPQGLTVESVHDGFTNISWVQPERLGGSSLLYYVVEWKREDVRNWSSSETNKTHWDLPVELLCQTCATLFKVAAVSAAGVGNFTDPLSYSVTQSALTTKAIVAIIVTGILSLLLLLTAVAIYIRHKQYFNRHMSRDSAQDHVPIILPKDLQTLRQVTLADVSLTKQLGEGNFGKVYEGFVRNLNSKGSKAIRVAFKTLMSNSTSDQRDELVREALTMRNLHHPNVVSLLGLCVDDEELWLILELLEGGDLLSNLRSWRPYNNMHCQASLKDLARLAHGLAEGCTYLRSLGYVHRDLAARNCLVSSTNPAECIAKIADFGLTRGVYARLYYKLNESSVFPVRWTAPEVLHEGRFCPGADIWSFGVLVWEIMTLGDHPYGLMSDIEVISYVKSGKTLSCPLRCPAPVRDGLRHCWTEKPQFRCNFEDMAAIFHKIIAEGFSNDETPYISAVDDLDAYDAETDSDTGAALQANATDSNGILIPTLFDNMGFEDFCSEMVVLMDSRTKKAGLANTIRL